jgi:ATP-dependent DNA helicase RecG
MLITDIKGIGAKTGALFHKLGIEYAEDLLTYYPRSYQQFHEPVAIRTIKEPDIYTVYGMVSARVEIARRGSLQIVSTVIRDEEGDGLKLTWFNMAFLVSSLKRGSRFIFRGRVVHKQGVYCMEQPAIYSPAEYDKLVHTMQPVYALTSGLTNNMVMKAVRSVLSSHDIIPEYLPADIVDRNNFMLIDEAIRTIHFPKDPAACEQARKRIVFDEFFFFILALKSLKTENEVTRNNLFINPDSRTDAFLAALPYELTGAQKKVLGQIRANLSSGKMMNRLVQGDVGSGKTIVALAALMDTVYAGYQAAMMAPTEVLARQHFEGITHMFVQYGISLRVVLLVGSMTSAAKKKIHQQIADGDADIIIGTNAIIQKNVAYPKLALVITDEQHRFGVNQRRELSLKGQRPHVLVMSATPIPRTLAIILYGDLDVSVIDELPANRLPIKNCVVDESYRQKAYAFMRKEIAAGHQVYVICPLVEESENSEAENVMEYAQNLSQELSGISVSYLHGRMKPSEKNGVMEDFSSGKIQVLVSTTVVEVGVNVPNATVMMIENADKFGLAQLHQLRGRVGRGSSQSYCIFVNSTVNEKTKKRLEIMNTSNDGFYIANEDLKLRGPGDFFGVRQSGEFQFSLGDIYNDADMLTLASECAQNFVNGDYYMNKTEEDRLRQKVCEYTDKCLNRLNI